MAIALKYTKDNRLTASSSASLAPNSFRAKVGIIGLILNLIYLGYVIWLFATLGMDGIMEMNQDIMEQYGG